MRVGDNLETHAAIHDHQAGILAILTPSVPCRIIRWGITVHLDHFDSGSAVIALHHQTHAEDGTISEDTAAGTKLLGITDTDYKEGAVLYCEPSTEIIVKPGDSIDINMTTGGTAGDIVGFIQYQQLNWDKTGENANWNDATPTNRMTDLSADA
jgi:hypothetical protein